MFSLPDYQSLAGIYQSDIDKELRNLSSSFEIIRSKFQNQSYAERARSTDGDLDFANFHDERVDGLAVEYMVRDLKAYRETARSIITTFKAHQIDLDEAVRRTNTVVGRLTGFRKFVEDLRNTVLTDVMHARLDTRLEVCQEEIIRTLIRTADIERDSTVAFDPEQGVIRG